MSKLPHTVLLLSVIILCSCKQATDPIAGTKTTFEKEMTTDVVGVSADTILTQVHPVIDTSTPSTQPPVTESSDNPAKPKQQRSEVENNSEVVLEAEQESPEVVSTEQSSTTVIATAEAEEEEPSSTEDAPITAVEAVEASEEIEQKEIESEPTAVADLSGPDHSAFDELLAKYVDKSGRVNYQAWQQDQSALKDYLKALQQSVPEDDWSRGTKLAYWINAYNAYTIQLILDHFPIKSIMELHGGKPWDVKWISIRDKELSLNNIENDIIRPQFGEPRIHFAVNCAAKSCPPLANAAYTADNLDQMLEARTRSFLNNPDYNLIRSSKVEVSKIFDWYAIDFGTLIPFINQYSTTQVSPTAKVDYMEYDWSLNN